MQPRDGEPFPTAVTVTTLPGSHSNLPHLRRVVRDISERKRTEEALRQSENRLRFLSERLLTIQEDERKRIARDLHDSLAAILAAAKFDIEGVMQLLRNNGTDKKWCSP